MYITERQKSYHSLIRQIQHTESSKLTEVIYYYLNFYLLLINICEAKKVPNKNALQYSGGST